MKNQSQELTVDYLKSILDYDQDTGIFTWKTTRHNKVKIGSRAGSVGPRGYWIIKINNRSYRAGRLAWFFVNGKWPTGTIDHKDTNIFNDAIDNLREANRNQQSTNRGNFRKQNDLPKWVVRSPHGKFQAWVKSNKKRWFLGTYPTPEEAHAVAANYAKELHGEFFNSGITTTKKRIE